jgi:hypothetical protein
MTGKVLLLMAMMVVLLAIAPPASADYSVTFPDGSQALEMSEGFGLSLSAFLDVPGDFDIFVFTGDTAANPLFVSLFGSPAGFAYWFNFTGRDAFGRLVFDVFVNQGTGFFFVETVALAL